MILFLKSNRWFYNFEKRRFNSEKVIREVYQELEKELNEIQSIKSQISSKSKELNHISEV